jgi:hypothetical protein
MRIRALLPSLFEMHKKQIFWGAGIGGGVGMRRDGLSGNRMASSRACPSLYGNTWGSKRGTGSKNRRKFQNWSGGPKKDAGILTGKKKHPAKIAQEPSFAVRKRAEPGSRKYKKINKFEWL